MVDTQTLREALIPWHDKTFKVENGKESWMHDHATCRRCKAEKILEELDGNNR